MLEGFWVLSRTRQGGGWGIAPIGVPSVTAYLDLIECPRGSDRLMFLEMVLALDATYLEWTVAHGEHSRSDTDAQS